MKLLSLWPKSGLIVCNSHLRMITVVTDSPRMVGRLTNSANKRILSMATLLVSPTTPVTLLVTLLLSILSIVSRRKRFSGGVVVHIVVQRVCSNTRYNVALCCGRWVLLLS